MRGRRPQLLSAEERRQALADLAGWQEADEGRAIAKSFKFGSFAEAFAFMTRTALAAEKMDHHPEWRNVYSRIDVKLSTHSAGGVSALDVELAKKMNEF